MSSRPTRTYGKGKARATSLPARESSPIEAAPSAPLARRTTVGRPVRTLLEYPILVSTLNLLGSYLDPATPIDTTPGLPDRLMRAVVQAAPHIVRLPFLLLLFNHFFLTFFSLSLSCSSLRTKTTASAATRTFWITAYRFPTCFVVPPRTNSTPSSSRTKMRNGPGWWIASPLNVSRVFKASATPC